MKTLFKIGLLFILLGVIVLSGEKIYACACDYNNKKIEAEINSIKVEDISYKIANDELVYNDTMYKDKYDKEILTRKSGESYKIIKIKGTTIGANYHYEGYMAVIYDPSKVVIAKSSGAGVNDYAYGETLDTISRKNNAVIAMNAGGFYDPYWNSAGGIPHGPVIINGKIDTNYSRGDEGGGIIGFNKNNKLVLKNMSAEEAVKEGIRDAVDWGPFLIVNGKNNYKGVKEYTWACQRTVIGQRKDGIVLMLVIDGLQKHSHGVSHADTAAIMERYGAVNAANLDGGTSASMTINHKFKNSPWNGYRRTTRRLPNAWIMKK